MAIGRLPALENVARVFGDTSYFFAVLNPEDPAFGQAVALSLELLARRVQVVTTWDVVVECVALLRYRTGFPPARRFLREVLPGLQLLEPTGAERAAAVEFFVKRGAARRLSLCDAISYVVVSTRLNWAPCLSFDDDFAALGLTIVR